MIPERAKEKFYDFLSPFVRLLIRLKVKPNTLTIGGFFLSIVSAYFFAINKIRLGGVFVLLSGFCDAIDGSIARGTNRVTTFGKFLDSTIDRYSEVALFIGILLYFIRNPQSGLDVATSAMLVLLSLAGSLLVSYTRARAEGLGEECAIGFMERTERILVIAFGAIFGEKVFLWAIVILAIFTHLTAVERMVYIRNRTNKK